MPDLKQQPLVEPKQPEPKASKRLPQKFIVKHAILGLQGRSPEERVTPIGAEVTLQQLGEQNARMMLACGSIEAAED